MTASPAKRCLNGHVDDFTKWDVLALAGGKFFLRGIGCIGAVSDLEKDGDTVSATVQGSDLYEVELHVGDGGLSGRCTCPWAQKAEVAGGAAGGNFCKHCVAVALVYIHERDRGQALPQQLDVRSYLALLDHDELVELIAEAAQHDRKLRHQLHRRATVGQAGDREFRYPRK
jgi:uncharacterized Zn finger protein